MSPHYHITKGPELEDPNLKQEWFSHWLLGAKNGVQKTPEVDLYSINGEHWEHFTRFPLPKTSYKPLYLSGAASGSSADLPARRLSDECSAGQRKRLHGPAAPGLEPVLAADGAVDRGRRLQPDL